MFLRLFSGEKCSCNAKKQEKSVCFQDYFWEKSVVVMLKKREKSV
jgi:hypothetical protein